MTSDPGPGPLFGGPPADEQLFGGGSVLDTRTGVCAAADSWSVGTGGMDFDALAYDLLEISLDRPGGPPENAAGRRASGLMMAWRFADALAAMPRGVTLPGPDSDDLERDHLVLATCRAAQGDDGALSWLRAVAPAVSATDWAGYIAHCLLRVGDARGDAALSEASLAQLQRLGDKGRRIVPRLAADAIGRRPRGKTEAQPGAGPSGRGRKTSATNLAVQQAARSLRSATDLLHTAAESFVSDPQPALDAAALLEQRDDKAGATLLLHAVNRTNPQVKRVEAALVALAGDDTRVRRLVRGALLGLGAIAFVVSGVSGYPIIAIGWALLIGAVEIFTKAPGLSRFDTGVLDKFGEDYGIKPFFRLPKSVADETPRGLRRPVLPLLLALVALLVGIVVYPAAVRVAASHGPAVTWRDDPHLTCFLVWILLFPVLVMWAVSLFPGRRTGYFIPTLPPAQAECQCRKWAWVSGPFAFAYDAAHLARRRLPEAIEPLAQRYGPALPLEVRGCPSTGAAWLTVTLGPEGGKVLVRSPIGVFADPDPRAQSTEELSTGQYL